MALHGVQSQTSSSVASSSSSSRPSHLVHKWVGRVIADTVLEMLSYSASYPSSMSYTPLWYMLLVCRHTPHEVCSDDAFGQLCSSYCLRVPRRPQGLRVAQIPIWRDMYMASMCLQGSLPCTRISELHAVGCSHKRCSGLRGHASFVHAGFPT